MKNVLSLEIPDVILQRCTKCKNDYPATNIHFTVSRKKKSGFHNECKVCAKISNQEWINNNKERCKERQRIYFKRRMDNKESIQGTCDYKHCNKEYIKKRNSQKYCSLYCLRANMRMRRGQWRFTGEVVQCKSCNKDFIKRKARMIYCSVECRDPYMSKLYYQNNTEKFAESGRTRYLRHPYKKYKKDTCELCGFIAVNKCQLDVDHIDGNHKNHNPDNLQTLCANCHRLKTFLNRDGVYSKGAKIIKICATS